eukprot:gnl/TRDRNA2_/TRDRNA2_144903_c1_seq1.p1 gnl/TRDRNA2_/TRDRNA2_144903_c1~~gnl/TRDRNA2_/TRDRNA2_144903_c1_seq1.p1  ORF type:complete len:336 (+),score=55.58 gnl/TRDRNA2_/TRDRNA2_144903_c1_seq1:2-1009(+)
MFEVSGPEIPTAADAAAKSLEMSAAAVSFDPLSAAGADAKIASATPVMSEGAAVSSSATGASAGTVPDALAPLPLPREAKLQATDENLAATSQSGKPAAIAAPAMQTAFNALTPYSADATASSSPPATSEGTAAPSRGTVASAGVVPDGLWSREVQLVANNERFAATPDFSEVAAPGVPAASLALGPLTGKSADAAVASAIPVTFEARVHSASTACDPRTKSGADSRVATVTPVTSEGAGPSSAIGVSACASPDSSSSLHLPREAKLEATDENVIAGASQSSVLASHMLTRTCPVQSLAEATVAVAEEGFTFVEQKSRYPRRPNASAPVGQLFIV